MTDASYAHIPAGWYPDPRGSKQRRWWDGSSWTHALEPLADASAAAPGYANLPGPSVRRAPSPAAPTVARALDAEPSERFPTRRQLRDAETVLETQKQFAESELGENYAMGPAVSATQKPNASFSIEQFRNAADQTPASQLTKKASQLTKSAAISTASAAPVSSISVTGAPVSAVPQTHTFTPRRAATDATAATTGAPPLSATAASLAAAAAAPAAPAAPAAGAPAAPEIASPASSSAGSASPASASPSGVSAAGAALVAAAPDAATAVHAPKPFDASEFTNPVIPINPAAQAAKALAAASAAATATAAADSGTFVPVMRTGAAGTASGQNPTGRASSTPTLEQRSSLQNESQYQPFGMTPRITKGVMEPPTSVNTGAVWLLTVMPLIFLGASFALIRFAPDFYTLFIQGGLIFVVVIASFALAFLDRQQLTLRSHQSTASPAWIFVTPLAYLIARAAHTRKEAGRGWAPAIVFVLVCLAAAAAVVFAPLPVTAFFSVLS